MTPLIYYDTIINKEMCEERGNTMAVFAKPVRQMIRVKAEDTEDFLKRFNEHVITKEQIDLCEAAGRLFMHEGKRQK